MRRVSIVASNLQDDLRQGDMMCLYATLKRIFYAVVSFERLELTDLNDRQYLRFCYCAIHAVIKDSYRQGDESDDLEYEYKGRLGHLYYPLFTLEDDVARGLIGLLRTDLLRTRRFTLGLYNRLRQGDILCVEKTDGQNFAGLASFVQRIGDARAIVDIFDMGQEIEVPASSFAFPIFRKTEAAVKVIASLMNVGRNKNGWMRSVENI